MSGEQLDSLGPLEVYQAILKLSRELAGHRTLDELVQSLWHGIAEFGWFDHVGLFLHDPESNALRLASIWPALGVPLLYRTYPVSRSFAGGDVFVTQTAHAYRLTTEDDPMVGASEGLRHLRRLGMRAACYLPVSTPRTRLGLLAVASAHVDEYSPADVALFEQIAAQVAIAIEDVQLIERLEKARDALSVERDRVELLLRVTNAAATQLALPDLFTAIAQLMRDVIPHHYASLTLWDDEAGQLRRHALVFPTGTGLLRDGELVGKDAPSTMAFERGETILFHQADIEALGGDAARIMSIEGLRSVCCVPLTTGRAKYGTLNIGSPSPESFGDADVRLAEQVAGQLAIAIENATHFERAERFRRQASQQRDRLSLLLGVNNIVVSKLDSHALRLSVLESLRATLGHDYASLALYDLRSGQLRIEAMTYYDERGTSSRASRSPWTTRRPVWRSSAACRWCSTGRNWSRLAPPACPRCSPPACSTSAACRS